MGALAVLIIMSICLADKKSLEKNVDDCSFSNKTQSNVMNFYLSFKFKAQ